jgi:hypothetical protein
MAASCAIHIFVAPQPACRQWEPPPRDDEVATDAHEAVRRRKLQITFLVFQVRRTEESQKKGRKNLAVRQECRIFAGR